ncbi:cytochrome P450 2U1-like [Branchiostoma floridae x Branchiostoma japonicum]
MTIWTGRTPTIVLTGYETIRTALVKRAGDFSSRRTHAVTTKLRGDGITADGFIYAPDGPRLKQLRKFTLRTLRDFGVGKRSLEDKINEEGNTLVQEVLSQNGQTFDIRIMLQSAVCNIIFSIVFGDRLDYDNPDFLRLIRLLNTATETKPTLSDILVFILPVFRYLQPSEASAVAKADKMYQALRKFCSEQIQKHRMTFDPNDIRDFLDAYLLEQHRATDERARETFSDKQLKEVLIDLFLAGTDTVAATLHWALLYMMVNPDIQEKVHQEIDSVLGQSAPSYAQRNLLPYTTATLAEVQRFKPVAPLSVQHTAPRDTTLNGYNIPQNAPILINLWSVHMDPQLFPEPNTFKPERFLDQDGNFVKHEALIPFSLGHRVCLGEQLAKMELFLLFVSLMQRFTFHMPEGAPKPSMSGIYEVQFIVNLPCPFKLCAVPRG